jgi:hypothetical protein
MAKMDMALFTRRRGLQKHTWPTLAAKIKVGNGLIQFNKQATHMLGVWMHAHLMFKEHENRCMKKTSAAKARLQSLTKTYRVLPESVRQVHGACVQAVALYGTELWWDHREVGSRDDLQLLINQ